MKEPLDYRLVHDHFFKIITLLLLIKLNILNLIYPKIIIIIFEFGSERIPRSLLRGLASELQK